MVNCKQRTVKSTRPSYCLDRWLSRFDPMVVLMGFVVDEAAFGQVLLRVLRCLPTSYSVGIP
jgi:hypothetical protein